MENCIKSESLLSPGTSPSYSPELMTATIWFLSFWSFKYKFKYVSIYFVQVSSYSRCYLESFFFFTEWYFKDFLHIYYSSYHKIYTFVKMNSNSFNHSSIDACLLCCFFQLHSVSANIFTYTSVYF